MRQTEHSELLNQMALQPTNKIRTCVNIANYNIFNYQLSKFQFADFCPTQDILGINQDIPVIAKLNAKVLLKSNKF